eukprot:4377127-Pyramimonas_sp.AAC.1
MPACSPAPRPPPPEPPLSASASASPAGPSSPELLEELLHDASAAPPGGDSAGKSCSTTPRQLHLEATRLARPAGRRPPQARPA